ncbi:MAG TPA: phosphatase PAP2 family protein [Steroidobacteraceae bacterium]|nr:phosphatase PAP2 family protein [Steroidobacteraceae bacterium]
MSDRLERSHVAAPLLIAAVCLSASVARGGEATEQVRAQEPDRAATSTYAAARMRGFLEPGERPDSLQLVPAPPRKGSPGYEADVAAYRAMRSLRDTARWRLAIADANVQFPHAAATFACSLGTPVTQAETPNLYSLLQRAMIDAGQSTTRAKDEYRRSRPFAIFDARMCVPEDAAALRKSGAYPSGHASAGWAWALILAEIAPDRAMPILRRGYEFGLSRVVCGVHWLSDIEAGRTVGAATVARLHAEPEFVAQLAFAREEVARLRAAGSEPGPDCVAEARALEATAGR